MLIIRSNVVHLFALPVCLDEWKVSITTGVYKPEDEDDDNPDTEKDGIEDSENANNNANDRSDDESEGRQHSTEPHRKKRSAKYKVAPFPPTCPLMVVMYGDKGKSPMLPLMSCAPDGIGSFQPGSPDDFKVSRITITS